MYRFTLTRIARRDGYTIGRLDDMKGERICDTLEPQWRDLRGGERKVRGRTAIPEGEYRVVVTRSERFGRMLPLLVGVPQFEGVRIHAGNTPADTAGCILVGENLQAGRLELSRLALERVMREIEDNNVVYIKIK